MSKNYRVIGLNNFDKFVKELSKIPEKSEKVVNKYLHRNDVLFDVETDIKNRIPLSVIDNKKYKGKIREHARYGKSIKIVPINLGFLVTNEKYYQYLVFPELGVGTSKKKSPKYFVRRGIESNVSKIENELEDEIYNELTKSEFFE